MVREMDTLGVEAIQGISSRVSLAGEVDLSRFEEIDQALAEAEASAPATLEIDVSEVSFMDSQGLRLLLRARERAAAKDRRLTLVDPSPAVRHLLELSGLNDEFDITDR